MSEKRDLLFMLAVVWTPADMNMSLPGLVKFHFDAVVSGNRKKTVDEVRVTQIKMSS